MYRNDHQATVFSQSIHLTGHIVTGDHVQNHVHAFVVGQAQGLGHKVLGVVNNGCISAQRQAGLRFMGVAHGHKHLGTHGFGHLNGRHTNAAGAPLHQQGFACLQAAALKHVGPHGKKRFGQARSLHIAPALGHGQALPHRGHGILRIATTRYQRAHAVTHSQAPLSHGLGIARLNGARHLKTRKIRGARGRRISTGALQHVGAVHARGRHPNQHLTRSSDWARALSKAQHLWRTKGADFDGVHHAHGLLASFSDYSCCCC